MFGKSSRASLLTAVFAALKLSAFGRSLPVARGRNRPIAASNPYLRMRRQLPAVHHAELDNDQRL